MKALIGMLMPIRLSTACTKLQHPEKKLAMTSIWITLLVNLTRITLATKPCSALAWKYVTIGQAIS